MQALSWDFSTWVILRVQMQDFKVGARNLKIRNQYRINSVVNSFMFRTIFKILKELLYLFICIIHLFTS